MSNFILVLQKKDFRNQPKVSVYFYMKKINLPLPLRTFCR